MVIYVAGRRASGKSTAAKMFETYGLSTFDIGPELRTESEALGYNTPESFVEHMRAVTSNPGWEHDHVANLIKSVTHIGDPLCSGVSVVGFRRWLDLNHLRRRLESEPHEQYKPSILLYIHAATQERLDRSLVRDGSSAVQFSQNEDLETVQGVDDIIGKVDFIVENDGDLSKFSANIEGVWDEIQQQYR